MVQFTISFAMLFGVEQFKIKSPIIYLKCKKKSIKIICGLRAIQSCKIYWQQLQVLYFPSIYQFRKEKFALISLHQLNTNKQ